MRVYLGGARDGTAGETLYRTGVSVGSDHRLLCPMA